MHVISLLAQKGGVGKSTLTLHYAVEAERAGPGVVVIDIDSQQSASSGPSDATPHAADARRHSHLSGTPHAPPSVYSTTES